MKPAETALLVISGKLLDRPFSLDALNALRAGIERALSDREIVVVRRVATLSQERLAVASNFLRAGFDAVPADDEDLQAAGIMLAAACSINPPDEIVYALGDDEPVHFLRLLAGKTRRIALLFSPMTDELGANIEGAYDPREILSKEGVDVEKLQTLSWSERLDANAAPRENMAEEKRDEKRATNDDPARNVDALCQTQDADPVELLKDAAPEWNAALMAMLQKRELKCSAWSALEVLSERFHGLSELYLADRDAFREMLDPEIKLVEEEIDEGVSASFFYHASHNDMQPLAMETVAETLDVGSASDRPDGIEIEHRQCFSATNFHDVAELANLMARQCRWSDERRKLADAGNSFELEIAPRDRELEDLARPTNLYLWPKKRDYASEDLLEAAKCYDLTEKAFELLANVADARTRVDARFAASVMQLAANAQCYIKTMCRKLDFNPIKEHVQHDAFELLSDFRKAYYPATILANMKMVEELPLENLDEEFDKYEELREEFESILRRQKGFKNTEGKLEYHVKRIRAQASADPAYDWEKVVEATTSMCRDFGEPYSSKRFRDNLYDLVDSVPDELETTVEFARVVQAIDVYKQQQEEELLWAKPDDVEEEYSPEVLAVRKHYAGAKAVFIGGTPQEHLRNRLSKKLNLDLIWFETDHGDSLDRFNPYLRDPDVKLFIVYIPWCSHKHSLEFSKCVKLAGKDFARIRKGTSPELIAHGLCAQIDLSDDMPRASDDARNQ